MQDHLAFVPHAPLGAVLATAASAAWRTLRDAWQQRERIRITHQALAALDAHLLRDLGLDRSEIASVAVEVADLGTPMAFERMSSQRRGASR